MKPASSRSAIPQPDLFRPLLRDIERQSGEATGVLREEMAKAKRLLSQRKTDSGKLYSLHEPQVECIAMGKAHKRYEFGCKASFVTAAKNELGSGSAGASLQSA